MAAYIIIDITIKDEAIYAEYVEKIPPVVEKHGGRYLIRGGTIIPTAGNWNPDRVILVEFENMEKLSRCFASLDYQELAPLRERSTVTRSIVVQGV